MYYLEIRDIPETINNLIQKDEFVFLEYDNSHFWDPDLKSIEHISNISTLTSRFFVYMNLKDEKVYLENPVYNIPSVRWIGVPIEVGSGDKLSAARIYSNIDEKSIKQFELYKEIIQKESVIPVFKPTLNRYQLGPTLLKFFQSYNLDFAFIHPVTDKKDEMVLIIREAFEYLRLRGFRKHIYFTYNLDFDMWNAKTFNTFSGLKSVHMDLSNKCTHSCVFCGLWGPDFIDALRAQEGGVLTPGTKKFMNQQISFDRALAIIQSVPETTNNVQLGGAGDPLTHPNWLEIITAWRTRGFETEVLSNFEYPSFLQLEALHALARGKARLAFYVNISAATPETYTLVRPRQSNETFDKVILNLAYMRGLEQRDGFGVKFTLIHIINSLNYHELVKMVELSYTLRSGVWLKPLEIHNDIHRKYSIPKDKYDEYKEYIKLALEKVDQLNVKMHGREFLEAIINSQSIES